MSEKVVPMIHVPNVRATVAWYESIGFKVRDTYSDGGDGLSFAVVEFGNSWVMFNQGGQPSSSHRREVDLYAYVGDVDALFGRLKDRVEVFEGLHDTFYGMREFIIRDLNRFWITFGQPSAYAALLQGVRNADVQEVKKALHRPGLNRENLSVALGVAATAESRNPEIVALLTDAGADLPAEVDSSTLRSYVGTYKGEQGAEAVITIDDGQLVATPKGQQPSRLVAVDKTKFRPIAFDGVSLVFNVEAGVVVSMTLNQDQQQLRLMRVHDQ